MFFTLVLLPCTLTRPVWANEENRIARLDESITVIREDIAALKEGQRQLEKRIDDVQGTLRWGFGILFMSMIALVGFILWDRRTTVAPVVKRADRIEETMREYAKKDHKFAEVMRSMGLL